MTDSILSRNNVKVFGRGTQPMLFAHGFGCDQNMWRLVAPAFERDYRIVLFDYVGSGRSDLDAWNAERYGSLGVPRVEDRKSTRVHSSHSSISHAVFRSRKKIQDRKTDHL